MEITLDTKISSIINHSPEAIGQIASVNKHFEKLRNPILRKLLASRVTIREAARIGGCDPMVLIEKLCSIGFTFNGGALTSQPLQDQESAHTIPQNIKIKERIDIQPFLDAEKDPFDTIIQSTNELNFGEAVCVISPFRPLPLERILLKNGFTVYSEVSDQRFTTCFVKEKNLSAIQDDVLEPSTTSGMFGLLLAKFEAQVKYLDVSEMEMPMPMVSILHELDHLENGQALHVRHRKIPQYLLPELEERNFEIHINERSSGDFDLLIFRRDER